jgi:prepilin-type N-terminal cleavage/methylation domain-containing protein
MRRDETGFTLIELMVVMVIMGVLVAIGMPMYAGYRDRALDSETESTVRTALVVEKLHHVENGVYTSTATDIEATERSLSVNVRRDPPGTVRIRTRRATIDTEVCLFSLSRSGHWFALYQSTTTGALYGHSSPKACRSRIASGWSSEGW